MDEIVYKKNIYFIIFMCIVVIVFCMPLLI